MPPCLTLHIYKVSIKGKMEQSREMSSAALHLVVVVTEKGALGSPSITVAKFTFFYIPSYGMLMDTRLLILFFILELL